MAAPRAVRRHRPDVVLLDVGMPGVDGIEVCRQLKSDPLTRLTPVVLVTGLSDLSDRIKGIEAGADDFLSKPVHPHELRARVASLSRMKQLTDALDSAEAAFMALAMTIEARDPTTNGHCERLSTHAVVLGRALGLPGEDLEALHRGGYLHDVGKVGVPDSVLLKQGKLTPDEFALMKRHPDIGDMLCARAVAAGRAADHPRPSRAAQWQRLPAGPSRRRSAAARADRGIVESRRATSNRPYRPALERHEAARNLMDEVLGKFLRCCRGVPRHQQDYDARLTSSSVHLEVRIPFSVSTDERRAGARGEPVFGAAIAASFPRRTNQLRQSTASRRGARPRNRRRADA